MKRFVSSYFRKFQLLLAVAAASYPVHWTVSILRRGELNGVLWLYSLGFVATAFAALFVPGSIRVIYGIAVSGGVLFGSFVLAPSVPRLDLIIQGVLFSIQVLWGLQVASWRKEKELPSFWISFGILAHLVGQVLLLTDLGTAYPSGLLCFSMYCFALLTMFSVNRRSLLAASGKRGQVPHSVARRNLLLILVLFLIGLAGSAIPSAFLLIRDGLLEALRWIGDKLSALFAPIQQPAGAAENIPQYAQAGKGVGQTITIPPVLETVMIYIGAAISIGFLIFILYRIGKKLLRALVSGWGMLGRFLTSASEDYVDEVTDTRQSGTEEKIARPKRVRGRYREDKSLPPGERVRKHFAYLQLRHPQWAPGSTAREKLPEQAARIYERARYSTHPISEEDPAAFADSIQTM